MTRPPLSFSALLVAAALSACGDKEPAEPVDNDGDGFFSDEDCDDSDPNIAPDVQERCNDVDDDCDGEIDEEPVDGITVYADTDGDGVGDPATSAIACGVSDGWSDSRDDCDDTNDAVYLGAPEVCDGVDNDCDNATDDDDPDLDESTQGTGYRDADGDGWGTDADAVQACALPTGYVAESGDCDDVVATVNPDAAEVCDGVDNDCDALIDDDDSDLDTTTAQTFYTDADDDGWGDAASVVLACEEPAGVASLPGDCDDDDSDRNPDVFDVCGDGLDNNCDGRADETCPISVTTADRILGGVGSGDLGGASLSLTGDLDGDGAMELAIGARRLDLEEGNEGAVFVFTGALSTTGTGLLSDASATLEGVAPDDGAGAFVHLSTDLTGDAADDLVVSARASDAGALDAGAVYLVSGPVSGTMLLSDAADAVITGAAERAYLGELGAGAGGDLNGDGVADLVATAWAEDVGLLDEGVVYVLFGPVTGTHSTNDADVRVDGGDPFDQAGSGWVTGGDLTGDGWDDLVVAAPGDDRVGLFEGRLSSGTSTTVTNADIRVLGNLNDSFGASVCTGDFDNDGHLDLVVGAPLNDDGGRSSGALFGFYGPFSTTRLASSADFAIVGDAEQRLLGTAAGAPAAGDLDGDGADELAVPSLFDDDAGDNAGAVTVWFEPLSGTATTTDAWRTLEGAVSNDNLGTGLSIGDLDGDGLGDLGLGSPAGDAGTVDGGTVYLFSGATL